jgi:kojibiose phosphorylase
MPIPELRGFIFDLDGVLTDTSELHYLAWQQFCDEEQIAFDRQRCESLRGVHRAAAMETLLEGKTYTPEQFEEMLARKNTYYLERLQQVNASNCLPGVVPFLHEIRQAGYKMAVASASKNAPRVVKLLEIGHLFDAISDGNCVSNSKPAPDLFLHAAGQLELPPKECVVFEDASAGVTAGRRAGMRVVGLGPEERVGHAHIVMDDLSKANLDAIMTQLTHIEPPAASIEQE